MPEESLQKLYDSGSEFWDIGDFETFSGKMQVPESRKKFYDALSQHYDLGPFDVFESKVQFPAETKLYPEAEEAAVATLPEGGPAIQPEEFEMGPIIPETEEITQPAIGILDGLKPFEGPPRSIEGSYVRQILEKKNLEAAVEEVRTTQKLEKAEPGLEKEAKIPPAVRAEEEVTTEDTARRYLEAEHERVGEEMVAQKEQEEAVKSFLNIGKGGFLQQAPRQFIRAVGETGLSLADLLERTGELFPEEFRVSPEVKEAGKRKREEWKNQLAEFTGEPEGLGGYAGATIGRLSEFIAEMYLTAGLLKPLTAAPTLKAVSKIPGKSKFAQTARYIAHKAATDVP